MGGSNHHMPIWTLVKVGGFWEGRNTELKSMTICMRASKAERQLM